MIILIKLILAHLVGDFLLQPGSWVETKEKKKWRAYQLYLHAVLHGIIILLLIGDFKFWPWAALLAFTHLFIDGLKLTLQTTQTKRAYFFIDQLLHIVSIYLIYCWYKGTAVIDASVFSETNFLLVTIIFFLTSPSSIVIKTIITRWAPHTEDSDEGSLQDAGKYIGILERLFVFVFAITGHWEAVGFLLAAKSVFRFGDLKESKDRKLTEYILIGTLISFGIAILAGLIYITLR